MNLSPNKITSRQACLYFALLCPLTKALILPHMIYYFAFRDSYLVILIFGIIDITILRLISRTAKENSNTIDEFLDQKIGMTGRKVFFFLYGLFFVLKALPPSIEQSNFSYHMLYGTTQSYIFIIPIYGIYLYLSYKGMRGCFRLLELISPLIAFSLIIMILLGATSDDPVGIFPVLEYGVKPLIPPILKANIWFGDFIMFMPLVGNVKKTGKFDRNVVIAAAIGVIILTILYILVLDIFGVLAPCQTYFIGKIAKYTTTFSNIGRIDIIFLIMLYSGMILHTCIMIAAAVTCFTLAVGGKRLVYSIIIATSLGIFGYIMIMDYHVVFDVLTRNTLVFVIIMQYILPIIIIISARMSNKKNKQKGENNNQEESQKIEWYEKEDWKIEK